MTVHASTYFSFPQHWNSHDLASAVPVRRRLSQVFDFDAMPRLRAHPRPRLNRVPDASRPWPLSPGAGAYLRTGQLPQLFRIR